MERAAAVGWRGQQQWDGEGGRHVSVGGRTADMEGTYGGRRHADWVGGSALGGGSETHRGGLRARAWVWTWDAWTWGLVVGVVVLCLQGGW